MFQLHRGTRIASAITVMLFAAGCGGGGDAGGDAAGGESGGQQAAPMESPVDASTAGDISGTVTFDGEAPAAEPIDMGAEPACAETYEDPPMTQEVLVGANGGLANVFVYVREGLEDLEFPTPQQSVEIDQQGCRYIPHVLGVQTGQTLVIRNSDGILHNINAQPQENRGFNISQPVNMTSERTFPIQEVMIPLVCDVHGWMNAYLGVMSHPFHAVSAEDGSFDLSTLPPGDYVVEAWHERYGTQTQNVTVATGETAEVQFSFSESMAENAEVPLAEPIDLHDHEAMHAPAATE